MRSILRRLRDRWIDAVLAHHRLVLAVGMAATAASTYAASRLEIASDLRALLPPDHEVVTNMDAMERSFGVLGDLKILVEGGDTAARNAFVEALVVELQKNPDLVDVDYRLPTDFFIDHALYYLTDAEFTEIQEHVEAWQHYELCSAAPDTCLEPPDPRAPDRLRRLVDRRRAQAIERTGFEDYYQREGVEAQYLAATPKHPPTDLAFATTLVDEADATLASLLARPGPWSGAGLSARVTGAYLSQSQIHAAISRDIVRSGVVGVVGVLAILYVLFRSTRAVFTLLVPLACGVSWSMGLAYLLLGRLNTITALITTVLVGIGIDAGIHLLARVRREIGEGPADEAIRSAFRGLATPLLVAVSTTVGAFAMMALSSFPAFREFGLIAAAGMLLCLLAMVSIYPALLHAVGVKAPRLPTTNSPGLWARLILRRPGTVFAAGVVATLLAIQGARQVQFERDGRSFASDATRTQLERDYALIHEIFRRDSNAAYLLVDDLDAAKAVLATARPRHDARKAAGETLVSALVGPVDLLPAPEIDLEARKEAIAELAEALPERALDRLADPSQIADDDLMSARDARLLQRMLAAQPFGLDDLPPALLRKIRGHDGRYLIAAYMGYDAADILDSARFLDETRAYTGDQPGKAYVGETTAHAAIYELMRDEAPVVVTMALVLIIALVFLQLRSVGATLLTLVPLGLAFWWMTAAMGWLGIRYTLLNVPILPAILGLGVDNGVYLMDRLRRARTLGDLARSVGETGGAILAATATTMLGFAAFAIAESGGLRAIGEVAVLGIAMAALAALTVLPAIVIIQMGPRLRRRSRRRKGSRAGGSLPPEPAPP